ncbi:MAG: OsmC family protein [Candidatus Binataceae bacterium]
MESAPPSQFGGPGNLWSPEAMLAGAVAGCFILTFRSVERASSLPWLNLTCTAEGHLERSDGALRFTEFNLSAKLTVSGGTNHDKAVRLLEKAEHGSLISNSLRSMMRLESEVIEMAP